MHRRGALQTERKVHRDQMATFLVRAAEFRTDQTLASAADYFQDDDGNPHEPQINKAAEAGFTGGTASGDYQPAGVVSGRRRRRSSHGFWNSSSTPDSRRCLPRNRRRSAARPTRTCVSRRHRRTSTAATSGTGTSGSSTRSMTRTLTGLDTTVTASVARHSHGGANRHRGPHSDTGGRRLMRYRHRTSPRTRDQRDYSAGGLLVLF